MTESSLIGVLMACSAIAFGTAIGWALALVMLPVADRLRWAARSRAVLYAQLRLLPLASALVVTVAQIVAFQRFEESRLESAGPLIIGVALAGVALVMRALWRCAIAWRLTAKSAAQLRATGEQVTMPRWIGPAWALRTLTPIVMVAGVVRPHLFVSWRVLRSCNRDELAAIAAHEASHVMARDNFVRLLFLLTPGVTLVGRLGRVLERRWAEAIEEAADHYAGEMVGPLELASALTKVARMSPGSTRLAASTFIGTSSIDTRVRRLIDGAELPRRSIAAWLPTAALLLSAVLLLIPQVNGTLHELFEFLVRPF